MLKYSILFILTLLAVGCQRNESEGKKVGVALIRLASGELVRESCLKKALAADVNPADACETVTPNQDTLYSGSGERGAYGSNVSWGWYFNNPSYTTYYYVQNPWYYNPTNFCGQYGGSGSCYNYLYPQYYSNPTYYYTYQRPNCGYSYGSQYGGYNSCWYSSWW